MMRAMPGDAPMTETAAARPSRQLGFWMCLALVIGNMVGSGVFLLPSSFAHFGWTSVGGWLIAIVGVLSLSLVIGALSRRCPDAGGPAGMVETAFGPLAGFLLGWSYWVSAWTAVSTISVAAASYLLASLGVAGDHVALPAILLILLAAATNFLGARAAGRVQVVTTIVKIVPLAVVAWLVIHVIGSGIASPPPVRPGQFGMATLSQTATLALWALIGFESASAASDRVIDAARTVPRATLAGTLITGAFYLIICSGIVLLLPAGPLAGDPAPFSTFIARYWNADAARTISAFAAIAAIGALNGWTLVLAEFPAAMARRGMLPRWFAKTGRRGTAVNALSLSVGLAVLLVAANAGRGTVDLFTFMALVSTSATLWLYLALALSAMKLRAAIPAAVVGGLFAIWALWGSGIEALGWSLMLMLMGLPLYASVRRERGSRG